MPLDLFLIYLLTCVGGVVLGGAALLFLCLVAMVVVHLPALWDVDEKP